MYHATFLRYDYDCPAPTAKEIQGYFKKSTRLLYGNNKRKSKSTPMPDKIHLVGSCFEKFKLALTGKQYIDTMLYIFDDKANNLILGLKYAGKVVCRFKLDEQIVDEMWRIDWSYDHLMRLKRGLQIEIESTEFFSEKSIGSKDFYKKTVPLFIEATETFISEVEQEMKVLELEAKRLFNSDWN